MIASSEEFSRLAASPLDRRGVAAYVFCPHAHSLTLYLVKNASLKMDAPRAVRFDTRIVAKEDF